MTQPNETIKKNYVIDVSVDNLDSIFSLLDPAPFRERDLDARAVQHIIQWAEDAKDDDIIELNLYIKGQQPSESNISDVQEAVDNYFEYEAHLIERQLKRNSNRMLRWLGIGMTLMLTLLTLKFYGNKYFPDTFFSDVICEGFVIMGWVSLWLPIERLVYEGLLVKEELNLYRQLSVMKVRVTSKENKVDGVLT